MTNEMRVYLRFMQTLNKMRLHTLIVILLVVLSACNNDEPEQTPTAEDETPTAVVEAEDETPAVTATPSSPTNTTPTLRATAPSSETAESQLRPISNAINIRSGPGERFEKIGLLYEDETAVVLGSDPFTDWYEIRTEEGQEGWVAATVVELSGSVAFTSASPTPCPQITADPDTTRLRVTINLAFIRSGPGQNYPVIDAVSRGSTISVLGHVNGAWFNIRLPDGGRGWIGATVTEPVGGWALEEIEEAATVPAPPPTPQSNCDPAYPTVCIPSPPPDLDCRDIDFQSFTVLPPDPHLFDGNQNGIGCEPLPD